MLNLKSLTSALVFAASTILFAPVQALANDNYTIISCDGCSDWSMRRKAESKGTFTPQKIHVYNNMTGSLKAYIVEKDFENGLNISTITSPNPVAAHRSTAAFQASQEVPEPLLPASIADSAWDYANFSALQNQTRDWLANNADWKVAALAKVQTVTNLFRGTFQPQFFVVHLESGGKVVFKTNGYLIDGDEITLHLVFEYAEDKDGNTIVHSRSGLNNTFPLSGGGGGTANAMASAATTIFGVDNVTFSVPIITTDSNSSFTCADSVDGSGLHCVKVN